MKNSTFLKVLLGALLLGASYGVVFFGGVALGRTQAEPSASTAPGGISALPTPAMPSSITFTPEDVARMRENLAEAFGGELPEQMQQMLDQVSDGGTIDFEALRERRQQMDGAGGIGPGIFGGR